MGPRQDGSLKLIVSTLGVLLSILFGGNVFFIKRLVDKIDSTEQTVAKLRQSVVVLEILFDNCQKKRPLAPKDWE